MSTLNVMSIDLEDWFCVYNLNGIIPRDDWPRCDYRVERSTGKLLDLFARHGVEATFFVLGWVAERSPDLIREIERRGHEIATHGYFHRLLTQMTPPEFESDLLRALEVTARCGSTPVGFRAPSFSVTESSLPWIATILKRCGLRYDSSIFPIGFHPDYGIPNANLHIHSLSNGLLEIPMSCATLWGKKIPCGGGGYFRLFPYPLTRYLMRTCNQQGRPVVFYLHPWEVDPGQPRVAMPPLKRLRHYSNLDKTMARLERLLADFRFTSIRNLLAAQSP
jgi:polysaccharide deacetylase family protein (PEP-CTERM system associated)